MVTSSGLGSKGSDGINTTGSDLEVAAYKNIVEWLNGKRKARRKMPHTLQPFLILGVQVLTRRGEDRMGHTLCISQSG